MPERTRRDLHGVQPRLDGKRVLIVDDNATNRRILTLQLHNWGMQTRDSETPAEALKWIKHGDPFDLAILDMHMPEMDGVTLARQDPQAAGCSKLCRWCCSPRSAGARPKPMRTSLRPTSANPSSLPSCSIRWPASLPTSRSRRRRLPRPELQMDPEMARNHPLRILLAEDILVNQKLALRLLQQMGYRADVASNGIEAVQSVERQPYDVILMDVQMPEMDGLEASRQICARWPRGQRPTIIAMTANAMQGDREMCLEAGMDDYVSKPIRPDELVKALMKVNPLNKGITMNAQSVIDLPTFEALKEAMGADFIGELVQAYFEETPQLLSKLQQALDQAGLRSLPAGSPFHQVHQQQLRCPGVWDAGEGTGNDGPGSQAGRRRR